MRSAYTRVADKIETVLIGVAEQVPDLDEPATIVLLEEEEPYLATEGWYTCTLLSECFTPGLRYLYENPHVRGIVCSTFRRNSFNEICEFTEDKLIITTTGLGEEAVKAFTYDSMIVLRLEGDKVSQVTELPVDTADYDPEKLLTPFPVIAVRVPEALEKWALDTLVDRYIVEFDQELNNGEGWWKPESSTAWSKASPFTLNTYLSPRHDYEITFRLISSITPDHISDITLFVNDNPVPLSAQADEGGTVIFQGVIPQTLVVRSPRQTRLKFVTPDPVTPASLGLGSDIRELGVLFDWLRIEPVEVRNAS